MNLTKLDISSEVYKEFTRMVRTKVSLAEMWLIEHRINYIWNYWAGNHLYRIYITNKDILLDFEYYPVNNSEYSYIRVNYDTDIIQLLEKIFPETVFDTNDLTLNTIDQREANHFLRENKYSPIYDKDVLRLAWAKGTDIYQCIIIKNNKIITNATKQNCSVSFGTFMILRYLTEMFGYSEIFIKERADNSFLHTTYQLIGAKKISQTNKKKIWWSPSGTKWHIKREDTDKYIPFYYCEYHIYRYSKISLVC